MPGAEQIDSIIRILFTSVNHFQDGKSCWLCHHYQRSLFFSKDGNHVGMPAWQTMWAKPVSLA